MNALAYWSVWALRLVLAIVVSFFIFTGVSLLHSAVGLGSKVKRATAAQDLGARYYSKTPRREKDRATTYSSSTIPREQGALP